MAVWINNVLVLMFKVPLTNSSFSNIVRIKRYIKGDKGYNIHNVFLCPQIKCVVELPHQGSAENLLK